MPLSSFYPSGHTSCGGLVGVWKGIATIPHISYGLAQVAIQLCIQNNLVNSESSSYPSDTFPNP
jgi:hypothetical protein